MTTFSRGDGWGILDMFCYAVTINGGSIVVTLHRVALPILAQGDGIFI